jgi:hypothetical protein
MIALGAAAVAEATDSRSRVESRLPFPLAPFRRGLRTSGPVGPRREDANDARLAATIPPS